MLLKGSVSGWCSKRIEQVPAEEWQRARTKSIVSASTTGTGGRLTNAVTANFRRDPARKVGGGVLLTLRVGRKRPLAMCRGGGEMQKPKHFLS